MRTIEFIVQNESISVKDYLKKHLNISTRSIIELKNIEGGLTLNGNKIRTVDILKKGDRLSVCVEEPKLLDQALIPYKILYQDENYVVFDKPAYTTVYKSGKEENNICDTIGNLYHDFTFRPFYRLDKNTSGTLLLAKNSLVMQGTEVKKLYYAVCHGEVPEHGIINEPISLEENSVIKRRCGFGGQEAVSEFERILFDGENSLIKVKIHTGRTHQIRVHFSYIGHPLLGDDLYGGKQDKILRQALHCGVCRVSNFAIGKNIEVLSEFPEDFKNAIKNKAALNISDFKDDKFSYKKAP